MTSRRASEPPAEHEHESAEHDGQPEIGDGGRRAEPALHDGIVGHHLARHVAEDPAAEPYDPLVPAHEIREETTPPHHEGQRQRNAEDHEHKVSLGGGGHAEHVVEAHGDVGHDDDPDRFPERRARAGLAVFAGARPHEPDGDPDEGEPAQELEERDAQKIAHHGDEGHAQAHRSRRAPQPAEELLARRQPADSERDDEGVVTGQRDVDEHDAEETRPEFWIGEPAHASLSGAWRRASLQPMTHRTMPTAAGSGYSSSCARVPSWLTTMGSSRIMSPAT